MTTMKRSLGPFAELATAFKNSFTTDIFTVARFKITVLYLVMGLLIMGVAGYLIYAHIISIVQNILSITTQFIAERGEISQNLAVNIITQNIDAEIQNMNLTVGIFVAVIVLLSAYILAGVTLFPIKQAMEKQKRFIANVSHELRTPLAVMKTGMEVALLDADALTNAEFVAHMKSNLEEVDRMSHITQFLLNFSNIEQRLTRRAFPETDLVPVAQNALGLMEKFAAAKQVALTFTNDGPAPIFGDPVALEELAINLLKNGVNYTPRGGTVSMEIARGGGGGRRGRVTLTVRDTGIGIPREDLPRLFEPFYRGKNALMKRDGQSMGLGLAIVKDIVRLHRARVSVESEVGKGTSVSVLFRA